MTESWIHRRDGTRARVVVGKVAVLASLESYSLEQTIFSLSRGRFARIDWGKRAKGCSDVLNVDFPGFGLRILRTLIFPIFTQDNQLWSDHTGEGSRRHDKAKTTRRSRG